MEQQRDAYRAHGASRCTATSAPGGGDAFGSSDSAAFSTRKSCRDWRACRCSRGGPCRGTFPAGMPARIAVERRIRRISQIRAGRRPAPPGLAGLRPVGPVLCQRVRGRYEFALLLHPRYQRIDGLRIDGRHQDRVCPADRRARWLSGLPAGGRGGTGLRRAEIVRSLPPKRNAAHLRLVLDMLEQTAAAGRDATAAVLHELAETIRQRALVIIISDLFVEPAFSTAAFSTCAFGITTWRCFICSIR